MWPVPLDWLSVVAFVRSDRWLFSYLNHSNLNKKTAPVIAERAIADLQYHNESAFRLEDIRAAAKQTGADVLPHKLTVLLQAANELLTQDAAGLVVRDTQRSLWTALVSKLDPAWLLGARLAYEINGGAVPANLLERQACELGFGVDDDPAREWADNHVHFNGLFGPSLALLDLVLDHPVHPINAGSWPHLHEFPLCSSGSPPLDRLSLIAHVHFYYIAESLFQLPGIKPPKWTAQTTWAVKNSVLRGGIVRAVNSAQATLLRAFDDKLPVQQRWLALVTALLIYDMRGNLPDQVARSIRIFMHATGILRSSMLAAGVGLGNFKQFFGFRLRNGSPKYRKVAAQQGAAAGVRLNLRIGFDMAELPLLARELWLHGRSTTAHVALHFQRSARRKERDGYMTMRRNLVEQVNNVVSTLLAASGRRYRIEELNRSETVDLGRLVRVIDVAGGETLAPIEWYAPALRALRAASSNQPGMDPWRISVHAGEDFPHLISGLRAVWETVEFCGMKYGDRLGHALALGEDVALWMTRQDRCFLTLETYFPDLLFLWHQASVIRCSEPVRAWLTTEIAQCSKEVFGAEEDVSDLVAAWQLRRNCPASALAESGSGVPSLLPWVPDFAHITAAQPTRDVELWSAWQRAMENDKLDTPRLLVGSADLRPASIGIPQTRLPPAVVDFVHAVQEHMVADLTRRGIGIEVCVTSNISLGRLRKVDEHPVFRWHAPVPVEVPIDLADDASSLLLPVCLNTDDPGLMPTSIYQEHWLLRQGAIDRGHASSEADEWVERLRAAGMGMFTATHQDWIPSEQDTFAKLMRKK